MQKRAKRGTHLALRVRFNLLTAHLFLYAHNSCALVRAVGVGTVGKQNKLIYPSPAGRRPRRPYGGKVGEADVSPAAWLLT